MMFYLLVDCNQFFVACEQVFNPKLLGRPVVVLSSSDGCILARSKEAKALGVPMGAPAYQWADFFKTRDVETRSCNFALYADMSQRVMQALASFGTEIEEYSVDEAFLVGSAKLAPLIKERVFKWTGIHVSIGIGPTKTLAKVANDLAKKLPSGILELTDPAAIDAHLAKMPAGDIWGVGPRLSQSLKEESIRSALQLKNADDLWLKKRFSVVLLRTVFELRGIPTLSLEETPEIRQSLTHARSFAMRITKLTDLEEALSSYVASAAEKLRSEGLITAVLSVFVTTSSFLKGESYYSNSSTLRLTEPTNYTPTLITAAKETLKKIYREGPLYKKVGITFAEITSADEKQPDLFLDVPQDTTRKKRAMDLVDKLNSSFGDTRVHFAAEGIKKEWKRRPENCSPRFTTRWDELLTVKI